MGAGLMAARLMIAMFAMALGYYLSYLILVRIQADAHMWFIWTITIPIAFLSAGIQIALQSHDTEEAVEKKIKEKKFGI